MSAVGIFLVGVRIQQVGHAEAVNTNLSNQLIRGNFEISSSNFLGYAHVRISWIFPV